MNSSANFNLIKCLASLLLYMYIILVLKEHGCGNFFLLISKLALKLLLSNKEANRPCVA